MSNYNNFNFARPRCAESLPRIPSYNVNVHSQTSHYPQKMSTGAASVAPVTTPEYTEITLRPQMHPRGHSAEANSHTLSRTSAAGTFFGVYGVSSVTTAHSAPSMPNRSNTLGTYGRNAARWSNVAKRNSLGHTLLLDKGGNALDDFYRTIDSKPSQFIVGRQNSARPHHVCYSLQCPCQPSATPSSAIMSRPTVTAIPTITGSMMSNEAAMPPLSAYYPQQQTQTSHSQARVPQHTSVAPPDLERFRRPVESPTLSESRSSLASSQQQQQHQQHQQQQQQSFGATAQPQLNAQGHHPNGYQDLEETSSEASSTRIASRMSGDPNVTTSTENDTRQLTNGCNPANNPPPPPYSPYCPALTTTTTVIHHAIPPNKKESLYSKLPSSVSSRQTLMRAVYCSSVLIAMLTALCIVILVLFGGRTEGGASALLSEDIFGNAMATGIGSGALSVVPAPTDLVDRSQVIIVNRRNPTQSAEQAAQLSDLLALVGAYNATARDAAFPSQLIQTVQPGCTAEEQFGYRQGEPCVAVVLRPDPAFVPVPLASSDSSDTTDNAGSNLLELECLCENRRNVRVAYSPYRGFPLRFFPRSARASPLLVMLRFEDLPLKTELRISCGLRGARNIDARNDRVNFQIMVI